MRHFANRTFWQGYDRLPQKVRLLADKNFNLLKGNPRHPSLRFKKIGRFWSARVGIGHRAPAFCATFRMTPRPPDDPNAVIVHPSARQNTIV